jgi:hypothetical protein
MGRLRRGGDGGGGGSLHGISSHSLAPSPLSSLSLLPSLLAVDINIILII